LGPGVSSISRLATANEKSAAFMAALFRFRLGSTKA
jgi:hypothetical protein